MPDYFTKLKSTIIKLPLFILLTVLAVGLPTSVMAEMSGMSGMSNKSEKPEKSADELSKELVNPAGHLWVLNSFVNFTKKEGDATKKTGTASTLLLQPVMPIMLNKKTGLTLMNRPTLPYMFEAPMPQVDATGQPSGIKKFSGVGDLSFQTALGKTQPISFGNFMWGIGVNLLFPTASKKQTGSGKYSAGPAGMLVGITENYTFGTVINQIWSYAGDDSRGDVNQAQFQFLYFRQMGNGWQIGDNPTWTAKWKASSGDKYDMPIGLGIFKTTKIGSSAWRFGITPRYFLKSYESWGNKWEVSFTITPILTNPFM